MSLASLLGPLGRGFKCDPPGHRWNPFSCLEASELAADDLPSAVDLRPFAPRVFDQGWTNSCVGHATSAAIAIACAAMGKPLPFAPSPAAIYKLALCLGNLDAGLSKSAPIQDNGCAPNEAMRGVSEWGVKAMGPLPADGRYSDAESTTITVKPQLDELEDEAGHLIVGMYALAPSSTFADDVARALACGYPVPFAVNADKINSWTPGVPQGAQSGAPDHYMVYVGYRFIGNRRIFMYRNSWGEGFGQGGYMDCDESFLGSTSIAYAMQVTA